MEGLRKFASDYVLPLRKVRLYFNFLPMTLWLGMQATVEMNFIITGNVIGPNHSLITNYVGPIYSATERFLLMGANLNDVKVSIIMIRNIEPSFSSAYRCQTNS